MLALMVSTTPLHANTLKTSSGGASYYHKKFQGRKTANGERFNNNAFTCAHRRFPFNTIVKVTHKKNGKTTYCRVNDRGPFSKGRIIDLSRKAASDIGMISQGVASVKVSVHCKPSSKSRKYNAKNVMVKCVENP
jgi:rare lipoprotein A